MTRREVIAALVAGRVERWRLARLQDRPADEFIARRGRDRALRAVARVFA